MKTVCCSIIFWLTAITALAQMPDSVDLHLNHTKLSLINHSYYISSTPETPVDSIVNQWLHHKNVKVLDRINFGYNDSIFWLIVPFKNVAQRKDEYRIEIQNPHIDKLQAYCVKGTQIEAVGKETGDNFSFNSRYLSHRNFVWPITACGAGDFTLMIRVEKRNSSLNIPVYLWLSKEHADHSAKMNMFFGLCFGMMFVVAIYSLIAGFFLKNIIYFIYFTFIISAIVFLATAEGLSFQFLYPNLVNFNSLFRVIINAIATVMLILFSREFLNTKKYTPRVDKVLLYDCIIIIILLFVTPFFSAFFLEQSLIMVPVALSLSLTANIACFMAAIISYSQQKRVASFYLAAYFITLFSSIISIMEDFGWIEKLPFNPLLIGALIEIMVFSLGLTYLMKNVYDERNELTLKITRHQKEMMQAYVQGVEKERERIAGELHDDIGSRLGNLRRMASQPKQENFEYIEKQIESLSDDVRNLSHQLSPPAMRYEGILQMVTGLVSDLQKSTSTKLSLQCYDVPEKLSEEVVRQTYRIIQEALNNIIKHAHASQADVQLFGHDHEFVITMEDNGRGFVVDHTKKGLGLAQMNARTEALGGTFEISSMVDHGTQLMISIPV